MLFTDKHRSTNLSLTLNHDQYKHYENIFLTFLRLQNVTVNFKNKYLNSQESYSIRNIKISSSI